MTSKHKLIREYLKKAQKNCPRKLRKHLDNGLKYGLSEFCDSQGDVTMEEIEKKFGKPEQYAAEYLSLCDTESITKRLSHSRKMILILFLVVTFSIVTTMGVMIYIIKTNENSHVTYIYENYGEDYHEQNN